MPTRPNILLLCADQWRADYLGYAGARFVHTPALDALAAGSTRFLNHYTVSVPCGPARASLLTGLYPSLHGVLNNGMALDHNLPTLPGMLRQAGYDPVLFGYTDTTRDPRASGDAGLHQAGAEGVMDGFRIGLLQSYDEPGPWLAQLQAQGMPLPNARPGAVWDRGRHPDGLAFDPRPAPYSDEQSDTRFLADHVIEAIESSDEAFCIHAAFLRPHPPLVTATPWHDLADPAGMPAAIPAGAALHPYDRGYKQRQSRPEAYDRAMDISRMDGSDLARARAVYVGMAAEVDHHLGRILEALVRTAKADNTLVIFTADHGDMLGDHGNWGKQHWYDSCYRIPLLIRFPGQSKGRETRAFTEAVDIVPTILGSAGLPVPADVNGHDLAVFRRGEPAQWRDSVLMEFDFRDNAEPRYELLLNLPADHCGVQILRNEHFKLVHFTALPPLLYDLQRDPAEQHNVAAEPAYQQVLTRMLSDLLSIRVTEGRRELMNKRPGLAVLTDADRRPRQRARAPLGNETSACAVENTD